MVSSLYFNSQPHKEADIIEIEEAAANEYFNSQPHKEADRGTVGRRGGVVYFNSQPHKEADTPKEFQKHTKCIFQLTASQGG